MSGLGSSYLDGPVASNPASALAGSVSVPGAGSTLTGGTLTGPITQLRPTLTLYDNFHRADTPAGQLGTSPTFGPWGVTGSAEPQAKITNNQFVQPNAGGTANVYAYRRFWTTPSGLRASVNWQPGPGSSTNDATVAILSSKDNGLINNCVHVIFNQHFCFVQKRIAGVTTTQQTITLSPAATTDSRPFAIGVAYNGSTVTVLTPDGVITNVTDPDYATLAGPWGIWEMGNGAALAEARILVVYADFAVGRCEITSARAGSETGFYKEIILSEPNLVSYWPLDEILGEANPFNSNTPFDNTPLNANPMSRSGGVVSGAPSLIYGDPSTGMTFDGINGFCTDTNPAAVQLTTFSAECWMQTSDLRAGQHAVFGKGNAWAILNYYGQLTVWDFTGAAPKVATISLADGKRHHLVMTCVSGGASQTLVYLDGRLVLTTTTTVLNNATAVQIGAVSNGTWPYQGVVQHCALYSAVLSAATILAHYRAGV